MTSESHVSTVKVHQVNLKGSNPNDLRFKPELIFARASTVRVRHPSTGGGAVARLTFLFEFTDDDTCLHAIDSPPFGAAKSCNLY